MAVVRINTPKRFELLTFDSSGTKELGVHFHTGWGVNSGPGTIDSDGIFQSDTLGTASIISYPPSVGFATVSDVFVVPYSAVEYLVNDMVMSVGGLPYPLVTEIAKGQSVVIMTPPPELYGPPGYVFSHWNTQDNGLGKNYYAGDTVIFKEPTTLYTQWRQTLLGVNYRLSDAGVGLWAAAQPSTWAVELIPLSGQFPATGCSFSSTSPDITLEGDINGSFGINVMVNNATPGTYIQTVNIQGAIETFSITIYEQVVADLISYMWQYQARTYDIDPYYVLSGIDQYGLSCPVPAGTTVSAVSGSVTQDLIDPTYYWYRPAISVSTDTITASNGAMSISDTIPIYQDSITSFSVYANSPITVGETSPVDAEGPSTLYGMYTPVYPAFPPIGDPNTLIFSASDGTATYDGGRYGTFTAPMTTGTVTITGTFGSISDTFDISVV